MSRARNWCFTLNNPTEDDYTFWESLSKWSMSELVVYAIMQEEVGEEGTVHLQGYMELGRPIRMARMKVLFGSRYHFEIRRGSQAQAITYCKKTKDATGGFSFVTGTPKRTGTGGKFNDAVKALKDGMTIEDAEESFPCQYAMWKDKLEDYALGLKPKRDWAMDIQILYGPSGTGKSYSAQQHEDIYVAPWPTGGRWWWPGYRGQHTVVMDEFRHQIKMDVMLKMMDRYVWHLEAKGRSFEFTSHRIIITTNIDPKEWYPNLTKEKKEPLARRIREFATIWDFTAGIYPNFVKTQRFGRFEFIEGQPQLQPPPGYNGGWGLNPDPTQGDNFAPPAAAHDGDVRNGHYGENGWTTTSHSLAEGVNRWEQHRI